MLQDKIRRIKREETSEYIKPHPNYEETENSAIAGVVKSAHSTDRLCKRITNYYASVQKLECIVMMINLHEYVLTSEVKAFLLRYTCSSGIY
jgi:hypothetical protein